MKKELREFLNAFEAYEAIVRPQSKALNIGDVVFLNSGSPPLLVVDILGELITAAWRHDGAAHEMTSPRQCFRGPYEMECVAVGE